MAKEAKKYKAAILLLIKELGGSIRGKKKLAKLLYFIDFDFYELCEKSITGDTYYARDMGPLGAKLQEQLEAMLKDNLIKIHQERTSGQAELEPTIVYEANGTPDTSLLAEEEIRMIQRVARKYGRLNGKQLEDLSHSEAPYVGTEPHQPIPYELSIYRGTEFTE